MKDTIEFLNKSICDIQSTIRAVDVKAGFLIAILFTPLYGFDKLSPLLTTVFFESTFHAVLVISTVATWALAILTVLMTVSAISNPSRHVSGAAGSCRGSFYGGDLFAMNILDTFWNLRNTSSRTIDQEIATLPRDEKSVVEELT
jgi:hypothetical protein